MFSPHSEEWLENKFSYYSSIREMNILYFSDNYKSYIVTKFEDVRNALIDSNTFSSSMGNLVVESPHRFNKTLGASDDPIHEKYKSIVKNAYSKDNIDRIVKFSIENIDLNDRAINISDLAKKISADVSAEIIGLPFNKKEISKMIFNIQQYSPKVVKINSNKNVDLQFNQLIDSLLNRRVRAESPGIYEEMLKNNGTAIKSLLTGPAISGASSMIGALEFLILDLFRENSIPTSKEQINLAIDESIRFNSSTGRFSRTVTKTTVLHNTNLQKGDRVILCLDAANRDPNKFYEPDRFNINRRENNLGFGYGIHSCIALAISKAVMFRFLEKLLNDFGNYKVVSKPKYLLSASGNNDMLENIIIERY